MILLSSSHTTWSMLMNPDATRSQVDRIETHGLVSSRYRTNPSIPISSRLASSNPSCIFSRRHYPLPYLQRYNRCCRFWRFHWIVSSALWEIPSRKSVLVMDNASFHHPERIEQLCSSKGVKLVYLPPYSPDLNPIEEFFVKVEVDCCEW